MKRRVVWPVMGVKAAGGIRTLAGFKAIYQGGKKHELTGHSFVAQDNYETVLGRSRQNQVRKTCQTPPIQNPGGGTH